MREIKFRAWDKRQGKMLPDDDLNFVIHPYDGTVYYAASHPDYPGDWVWEMDENPTENLIPMQYTGLKDKDGKEIYEGDILLYPNAEIIRVIWMVNPGSFSPKEIDILHAPYVIGNIYENPGLIEA